VPFIDIYSRVVMHEGMHTLIKEEILVSELLERTRRINRLIQNAAGYPVNFDEMASVLRDVIGSTVFVTSRKGKILGSAVGDEATRQANEPVDESSLVGQLNDQLLSMRDTSSNISLDGSCVISPDTEFDFKDKLVTVVPVYGGGERLGTLVLSRANDSFEDEHLILAEYAATVVGIEIMRSKSDQVEDEARKKAAVQVALSTLSYSELEAVEHIFDELNGEEGLLVASKIADRVGITRSVIVNALRKFESAGVIESRSLGMKGTYIRVKNDRLIDELKKLRAR
jgi:transcriptional pleiotropic repressor